MGQKITVSFDPNIVNSDDARGLWRGRENKIIIHPGTKETPFPSDMVEQSFFHELVHAVLEAAELEDISKQENIVDLVGGLLHQALTTAEYD